MKTIEILGQEYDKAIEFFSDKNSCHYKTPAAIAKLSPKKLIALYNKYTKFAVGSVLENTDTGERVIVMTVNPFEDKTILIGWHSDGEIYVIYHYILNELNKWKKIAEDESVNIFLYNIDKWRFSRKEEN